LHIRADLLALDGDRESCACTGSGLEIGCICSSPSVQFIRVEAMIPSMVEQQSESLMRFLSPTVSFSIKIVSIFILLDVSLVAFYYSFVFIVSRFLSLVVRLVKLFHNFSEHDRRIIECSLTR
jgi:hypothetical protein